MNGDERDIITTLYEKDPAGIKKIKFDFQNIYGIFIPRSNKSKFDALKIKEADNTGVYILSGEDKDTYKKKLYVGQTVGIKTRLNDHDKKKDWWENVIFFSIETDDFTESDLNYLEYELIKKVNDAKGIYICENRNEGNKRNNLKPQRINALNEKLKDIYDILKFLGYNFDAIDDNLNDEKLYYIDSKGVKANGVYDGSKMTVLKNSYGKLNSNSNLPVVKKIKEKREELLKMKIVANEGDKIVFKENYSFDSASDAAKFLFMGSVSGPGKWKSKIHNKLMKDLND